MKVIDLNSDAGERPEELADGTEEKLISIITSANIACGGHAGDESTMIHMIDLCKKYGINIGAHPSFPDTKNFGRVEMDLSGEEISNTVFSQVTQLIELADKSGLKVRHVKPHGALYNSAAKNRFVAESIASGVKKADENLILCGLAGSLMIDVWRDKGFNVIAEAFADRKYEQDGTLRSRKFSDSLIIDPEEAANQALMIAKYNMVISNNGKEIQVEAQTICIHSDTKNSFDIANRIHKLFYKEEIIIKPF
jgi:UPF0271 protein